MDYRELLERELTGGAISDDDYEAIFAELLLGKLTDAQIAGLLTAWRGRPPNARIFAAGARCLRKNATAVPIGNGLRPLADNCGTGGDGLHTFNISTGAAIIAASTGLRVAKHGNRSVSSRCGSADLLFAAGYPDSLSAAASAELLKRTGLTFFFAPNFHPMIKNVMPVRRQLGIPTVFNQLGPLANPIAPEYQLIGVAKQELLIPMAEAARSIGLRSAWVVCSEDGLDEVSPGAICHVAALHKGAISSGTIDPHALGLAAPTSDLVGGDAEHNLAMLEAILDGAQSAVRCAVVLNAAALLVVCEQAGTLEQGIAAAEATIDGGQAKHFFANWLEVAQDLVA